MTATKDFIKKIHFIVNGFLDTIYPKSILDKKRSLKALCKIKKTNIKLHVGCGPRILKGWINIDLKYVNPRKYLHYYSDGSYPTSIRGGKRDFFPLDVTKGIPLKDDSVKIIFHEDFFEHIDQKNQIYFLIEALRVLKKNGIHRINTPNLLKSNFVDTSQSVTRFNPREWDNYFHKNVITPSYIKEIAKKIGYREVIFNSKNRSISHDIPPEHRPGPDRGENGNIFVDLIK